MANPGKDRVFLSYAHEDLDTVWDVYEGLSERGLSMWFDKKSLGPGKWAKKIRKAISQSRYFVICLSEAALRKTGDERPGFQDEELDMAYRIAMDQAEFEFSIVPIRLEDCGRGDHRLATFNQYDLFVNFSEGLDRLSVDLGGRSKSNVKAVDERTEDQRTIDHLFGKALAASQATEYERELILWNSILAISPDHGEAWNNKGTTLLTLGLFEEALEAMIKALEIMPNHADFWFNKGLILRRLDRYEEALEAYNKALEIRPDHARSWHHKGIVLNLKGCNKEALEAFKKDLEIWPDHDDGWNYKGLILRQLDRYEEALEAYNKALGIKPNKVFSLNNKGVVLHLLGRYEEALEAYNKALEINPNHVDSWRNKSATLLALDRKEEATDAIIKSQKKVDPPTHRRIFVMK